MKKHPQGTPNEWVSDVENAFKKAIKEFNTLFNSSTMSKESKLDQVKSSFFLSVNLRVESPV